MNKEDLIPTQQFGYQTDVEEEKIFASPVEAKAFYFDAVSRLIDVNNWHNFFTLAPSRFDLFDNDGLALDRYARQSNYIRMNIPNPDLIMGNEYIWVCIEHMESYSEPTADIDFTLFVARPSRLPGLKIGEIAHFFTEQATSTFIVFRNGNVLSAEVRGRNELLNVNFERPSDDARNTMINTGRTLERSFSQWHHLVSGILR